MPIYSYQHKDIGTLIIEFPSISFDQPLFLIKHLEAGKVSAQDGKEINR